MLAFMFALVSCFLSFGPVLEISFVCCLVQFGKRSVELVTCHGWSEHDYAYVSKKWRNGDWAGELISLNWSYHFSYAGRFERR